MKWELRSSKNARLFTRGLIHFEAKDTVRKVVERRYGMAGKNVCFSEKF